MAKSNEPYHMIEVESYVPDKTSGLHGKVHIRPCKGQVFSSDLRVECSLSLTTKFPVGTRFRIRAKLTDMQGGGEFLYSSYQWKYEVLK